MIRPRLPLDNEAAVEIAILAVEKAVLAKHLNEVMQEATYDNVQWHINKKKDRS